MTLDQDGVVSCLALDPSDPVPSEDDFPLPTSVKANVKHYLSLNVKSETEYAVYCFAENLYEKPSQKSIAESKQVVKTLSENDGAVVIVGNGGAERNEATITILSSKAGKAWCIAREGVSLPTRLEIKEKASTTKEIRALEEEIYTIGGLEAGTTYNVYCTSESGDNNAPMISEVNRVVREVTTAESVLMLILRLIATAFCVCMSGLFSGLNLGLMGLDLISLRMISETDVHEIAGDTVPEEELKVILRDKKYATKILPIRKKGNLLLVTLLVGNVMVNSLISIITADLTSGTVGFIISTVLITTFGEVIPQAYGSRNGLKLGAMTVGITRVLICILFIICKPVSMILDWVLGEELGNIYNRYQLYTMFELYKTHSNFKNDTIDTMQGALVMDTKTVGEYYHKLEDVFMLSDSGVLDHTTCMEIFKKGYSRIPVYHENRQNIVGILYAKELIMVDPNQQVTIDSLLKLFPSSILMIDSKRTVADSIKDMVHSHTELAFVSKVIQNVDTDNSIELVGIVTMEDMVRAVMRLEMVDETPMLESDKDSQAVENIFGKVLLNHLDPTTSDIIAHFISQSLNKQHLYLPQDVITNLIKSGSIEHYTTSSENIYEVGQSCDFMTVIMQGVFTMMVGKDKMMTEKPIFSVINLPAILEDEYK